MVRILKKLSNAPRRAVELYARGRALSRLRNSGDAASARLARAIRAVTQKAFTPEEQRWIDDVEQLRTKLSASAETVAFTDFGAGEPGDNRTPDQMYQGRKTTVSIAHLCRHTSQKYPWAHLFLKLIREFQPANCLELGTCLGFSAAYQAAALELNGTGRLITLEGAEPLAQIAKRNFQQLGLSRATVRVGRFQDILGDVLREGGPFGFAFIDGHHDENATLSYFEQILPHLTHEAVVVFDDILWYEGMRRAWRRIEAHERVRLSLDLRAMGVVVTGSAAGHKTRYRFRL